MMFLRSCCRGTWNYCWGQRFLLLTIAAVLVLWWVFDQHTSPPFPTNDSWDVIWVPFVGFTWLVLVVFMLLTRRSWTTGGLALLLAAAGYAVLYVATAESYFDNDDTRTREIWLDLFRAVAVVGAILIWPAVSIYVRNRWRARHGTAKVSTTHDWYAPDDTIVPEGDSDGPNPIPTDR
jgi:Ca2+/Na+ antiporter